MPFLFNGNDLFMFKRAFACRILAACEKAFITLLLGAWAPRWGLVLFCNVYCIQTSTLKKIGGKGTPSPCTSVLHWSLFTSSGLFVNSVYKQIVGREGSYMHFKLLFTMFTMFTVNKKVNQKNEEAKQDTHPSKNMTLARIQRVFHCLR